MQHWKKEAAANRVVAADWGRTVPPISSSTAEVFHQPMENICFKPNFFPQPTAWHKRKNSDSIAQTNTSCPFHSG